MNNKYIIAVFFLCLMPFYLMRSQVFSSGVNTAVKSNGIFQTSYKASSMQTASTTSVTANSKAQRECVIAFYASVDSDETGTNLIKELPGLQKRGVNTLFVEIDYNYQSPQPGSAQNRRRMQTSFHRSYPRNKLSWTPVVGGRNFRPA